MDSTNFLDLKDSHNTVWWEAPRVNKTLCTGKIHRVPLLEVYSLSEVIYSLTGLKSNLKRGCNYCPCLNLYIFKSPLCFSTLLTYEFLLSLLCGLFYGKMVAVSCRNWQLENVSATISVPKHSKHNLTLSALASLKRNWKLHFATNYVPGVFTKTTLESLKKKNRTTKDKEKARRSQISLRSRTEMGNQRVGVK